MVFLVTTDTGLHNLTPKLMKSMAYLYLCAGLTDTAVKESNIKGTYFVCNYGLCNKAYRFFDVITSHGKLDRGSKWKNMTSHAQGRAPT